MTENLDTPRPTESVIRELLPERFRDDFDRIDHALLQPALGLPEAPDWYITAIITAPEDILTRREMIIKNKYNDGRIRQIPTESDVTAIHEAVITTSTIAAESIEHVKDKHAAPKLISALTQWWDYFAGGLKEHLDDIIQVMDDKNLIPDDLSDELKQTAKGNPALYAVPVAFMQIYTWWKNFSTRLESWGLSVERAANKKYGNNIPDWHDLINIAFYDDTVRAEVIDILLSLGIPEQYHDSLLKSAKTVLSTSEIMTAYWRGNIDNAERTDLLRKAGIEGREHDLIIDLFERIPAIQDVIQFAVKDAFNTDAVRFMGLDEDYPEQLTEFAQKNGYTEETAQLYWRAHWNALSPQMVFEMLHRGVVNEERADDLLRIADWPAGLRDLLMQISYSVPTRVDVRRMYRLGVYTEEQVFENYKRIGYNDDDAAALTEFTILNESEEERELTRSQIEAAYRDGILDRREAEGLLDSLGYTAELVEIMLDRVDLRAERDLMEQNLDIIRTRFIRHLMTANQLTEQLTKLGIDQAQIDIYMRQWTLDREAKTKRPTLATLRRWYSSGVIDAARFRTEMQGLGWGDSYIDLYEQEILQG